jgi:hypothetical protein
MPFDVLGSDKQNKIIGKNNNNQKQKKNKHILILVYTYNQEKWPPGFSFIEQRERETHSREKQFCSKLRIASNHHHHTHSGYSFTLIGIDMALTHSSRNGNSGQSSSPACLEKKFQEINNRLVYQIIIDKCVCGLNRNKDKYLRIQRYRKQMAGQLN